MNNIKRETILKLVLIFIKSMTGFGTYPKRVALIDGVFMAMKRSVFEKVRFDVGLDFTQRVSNGFEALDLPSGGIILFGPIGTCQVAKNRFYQRDGILKQCDQDGNLFMAKPQAVHPGVNFDVNRPRLLISALSPCLHKTPVLLQTVDAGLQAVLQERCKCGRLRIEHHDP